MKKMLLSIITIALLILCTYSYLLWDAVTNLDNPDHWRQRPLYSIRLTGNDWQPSDIHIPEIPTTGYRIWQYQVPTAHRYHLERADYRIEIDVNPADYDVQTILQILTTRQSDGQVLRVTSSWAGQCGVVGNTPENAANDQSADIFGSMAHHYFSNLQAVGFVWRVYHAEKDCSDPKVIAADSSLPIMLKIYDGANLLGEERIDFEIFENGIFKIFPAS